MRYVNYTESESNIGLGAIVSINYAQELHYQHFDYPYRDSIAVMLSNFLLLRMGMVNLRHSLQMQSAVSQTVPSSTVYGTRPQTTDYDPSYDGSIYYSLVGSLANQLSGRVSRPAYNEHNVSHGNLVGTIEPKNGWSPPWYYGSSWYGAYSDFVHPVLERYHTHRRNGPFYEIVASPVIGGLAFSIGDSHSNFDGRRPRAYFDDVLKYIKETVGSSYIGPEFYQLGNGWFYEHRYYDFSHNYVPYSFNDFFIEYEYELRMRREPFGGMWMEDSVFRVSRWKIRYDFHIKIPDYIPNKPSSPGTYEMEMIPEITIDRNMTNVYNERRTRAGDTDYPTLAETLTGSGGGMVHHCYWSYPTPTSSLGMIYLSSFNPLLRAESNLYKVEQDLKHLAPSSFYSSADALEKYFDLIETNHLETLKEIGDLASLVPDVGLLMRSLVDLKNLRLPSVVKLGDFIADTNLKYGFGIAPTVGAITELNEMGPRVIERLRDGVTEQTLYGKFVFELPEGYFSKSSGSAFLITRSKIRVSFDDQSLLMSMIGLRATGLMPGLSNLWELLPGSFIVDWFTNLGQRFKDIDNQALMLCCNILSSTHSYTIFQDIDPDFLDQCQLRSASPLDVPQYKVYVRHLSYMTPSLRNSQYDFRAASTNPDLGIVSSLAWKLSR